jgi:hypothetical protein
VRIDQLAVPDHHRPYNLLGDAKRALQRLSEELRNVLLPGQVPRDPRLADDEPTGGQ